MDQALLPAPLDVSDEDLIVDIVDGEGEQPEPAIEFGEDGSVVVDFEPIDDLPEGEFDDYIAHDANLAEFLEPTDLAGIGARILELVDNDIESRAAWAEKIDKGMAKLGVIDEPKTLEPFEGASQVRHPLLAEACVQFQARAIKELFPAKGPVKAKVLGDADEEAEERRDRVEGYMNYQYTVEMPEAFDAMDQMLLYLPMSGSAFKKSYYDPRLKRIATAWVRAEDLIVPYTATDLETAPRHTHRMRRYYNEMLKLMRNGFYRHIELPRGGRVPDQDRVTETIAKAEGREEVSTHKDDDEYEVLEANIEYDLPGFEDIDENNELTGIALPYIITVERETRQVLSIYRNWKEDDPDAEKRVWFTHYKYLPGFGFYGYGLLHMIGGLADAATGSLRALLDSAAFANLQGGFRKKTRGAKSGTVVVSPGHWEDIETAGSLKDHFLPLQYKEPSTVLFNLLGFLVDAAQRFSTTADAMVGDADNKGPVGTTLALIEQGSKVYSSIHARLHRAQGSEFKLVKELNAETIVGEYPYNIEGESRYVVAEDFTNIDVEPVSDPNIYSNTQRIAQAQAGLQLAESAPEIHDKHAAYVRMYDAMEIKHEGILIDPDDVPRMDPMTENMALMHQKAIKAYPDQAHEAHMAVHQAWFQTLPPEGQKMLQQQHMAHMAEHLAHAYRAKIIGELGFDVPLPKLRGQGPVSYEQGGELTPEQEAQVATMTAIALQRNPALAAPAGGQPQQPPPDPAVMQAQAEIKRKDEAAAADMKRKDAIAAADMKRQDMKSLADISATDAKTAAGILAGAAKQASQQAKPEPQGAEQ